jgi:hypothetical protein
MLQINSACISLLHNFVYKEGNQKYVRDCGGVTILIQQLTETQDEEFSKTIKYLLHMCVTSGILYKFLFIIYCNVVCRFLVLPLSLIGTVLD